MVDKRIWGLFDELEGCVRADLEATLEQVRKIEARLGQTHLPLDQLPAEDGATVRRLRVLHNSIMRIRQLRRNMQKLAGQHSVRLCP